MGAKTVIPSTLTEFKIFLAKNLGETKVFVYYIEKNLCNSNQYQQKNLMDWLAYMEHLQFILKKFDNVAASADNLIIWYF